VSHPTSYRWRKGTFCFEGQAAAGINPCSAYGINLHRQLDQLPKSGQHMLDELDLELKRRLWNAEVNETEGKISG
jgi:hypothetical protein